MPMALPPNVSLQLSSDLEALGGNLLRRDARHRPLGSDRDTRADCASGAGSVPGSRTAWQC